MNGLDCKIFRFDLTSPDSSLNPVNKSLILQSLCETNFRKLLRLAPDLLLIDYVAAARAGAKPELYIRIIERKPYTLTMELTHRFECENDARTEPALKIRLYLDAKLAEVLSDCGRSLQKDPEPEIVLEFKWTINYFLERWLDHCIEQGYRFKTGIRDQESGIRDQSFLVRPLIPDSCSPR